MQQIVKMPAPFPVVSVTLLHEHLFIKPVPGSGPAFVCPADTVFHVYLGMLQKMDREKRLKLRIGFYESANAQATAVSKPKAAASLGLKTGFGSENLWFLGFKYFLDGSMGGRTAAVSVRRREAPRWTGI